MIIFPGAFFATPIPSVFPAQIKDPTERRILSSRALSSVKMKESLSRGREGKGIKGQGREGQIPVAFESEGDFEVLTETHRAGHHRRSALHCPDLCPVPKSVSKADTPLSAIHVGPPLVSQHGQWLRSS